MKNINNNLSDLRHYLRLIGIVEDNLSVSLRNNPDMVNMSGEFTLKPNKQVVKSIELVFGSYLADDDRERLQLIIQLLDMLRAAGNSHNTPHPNTFERVRDFVISDDEIGEFITMLKLKHNFKD
jgi:hypothetical protein